MGISLLVVGYSIEYRKKASVQNDELHHLEARYKNSDKLTLEYEADTLAGFSGSPVILIKDNKYYIVGIHLSRKEKPS